jgi:ABC-type Fe3+/spermidine/putrescine transport system ATPase subunit
MVFQDYALFPHLDVSRNIEYGPRLGGAGRAERERLAAALAISLGIAALLRRRPATLSGGERQRVALARSLAAAPGLLLLDEPLSSLDAGMRRQLRAEIAARLRAMSLPALYVTHDVEEALAVADRLFVMDRGSIVEGGRPEEIYEAPRRAVTASFLGLGPVLPVLGLQGAEDRLSVLTALGPLCARGPLPEGDEAREALSVFFHADAAMPAPAGTEGAVEGRVLSSDFLGRRRRVALLCPLRHEGAGALPDGSAHGLRIEIDIPASHRPVPGERLWFTLPPGSCRLLAGRLDHLR